MTDIDINKIYNLLHNYKLVEIYHLVKENQNDTSTSIKAAILSYWFQEHDSSKKLLSEIQSINIHTIFFSALAKISYGDGKYTQKNIMYLIKHNAPRWMPLWLALEDSGRRKQFELQSNIASKLLRKEPWCIVPLLQSLQQQHIDASYLIKHIDSISKHDEHLNVLKAFLLSKSDKQDIAIDLFQRIMNNSVKFKGLAAYFLAPLLTQLGRIRESLSAYDVALSFCFTDKTSASFHLRCSMSLQDEYQNTIKRVARLSELFPKRLELQGSFASMLLVIHWLSFDLKSAFCIVQQFHQFQKSELDKQFLNAQNFFKFILSLCVFWQKNNQIYISNNLNKPVLYAIGDSHALTLNNINIYWQNLQVSCKSLFIMGIKMYHLGAYKSPYFKNMFLELVKNIKTSEHILICIGEIDLRPQEGIWPIAANSNDKLGVIRNTIEPYLNFLRQVFASRADNLITIQGIPAPGYELSGERDPGNVEAFLDVLYIANSILKSKTIEYGWNFLDVYQATANPERRSHLKWHIDGTHLKPSFYVNAAEYYLIV